MKAVIVRSHLRDALAEISRASGDNEKLPVLKCVLFDATEHSIVLTATNLEIAITASFSGKILEKGKIAVPIGVLMHIVGSIQGERLNIESKADNFEIVGDNYKATIKGTAADEFPIIPKITSGEFIEFQGAAFKRAIEEVLTATQSSDARPELNSILLDFTIDSVKIAGTDGFRLAEKTLTERQFSGTCREKFKMLIPLKTAAELTRVIGDGETVKVMHDEHQALFKTEKTECVSRLVQGNFPEYQMLVPKKFTAEAIVDKEEFFSALKLVSALADRTSEIVMRPSSNDKSLELHSRNQSLGDNTYVLPAKITGKMKEIVFNWRYLADAVRVLDGGEIFIGMSDGDHPALIKPKKDESYFYIVKPIAR